MRGLTRPSVRLSAGVGALGSPAGAPRGGRADRSPRRLALALVLLVAALAPPARAETALEAGTNANTWVFGADGALAAVWRLGAGATTATKLSGAVQVLSGGAWAPVPGTSAGSDVVVNSLGGSWPAPVGIPAVSVVALGAPVLDAAAPEAPGLTVEPADGTYAETVAVKVVATPSPLSTDPVELTVLIDGVSVPSTTGVVVGWVTLDGIHVVEATATQKDAIGTFHTKTVTRTFTLDGDKPRHRDTDGDGVPDFVEAARGMDPFDGDLTGDADGDGWSDLDELLRGTDAGDAGDAPADGDGDGWSDWDEDLRGTDPGDAASAPVARRLWEVELLLAGATWLDAAGTLPHPDAGNISARDVLWEELATGDAPLAAWPALRIPAGTPLVVRAVSAADPRSALSAWVPSVADPRPADIAADLEASGATWQTVQGWRADYTAALAAWLVREQAVDVTPATTAGVALVEAVIAWHAGLDAGAPVLLGDAQGATPVEAVGDIAYDGGLDLLHLDLWTLTWVGEPLEDLVALVEAWVGDPSALTASDVTRQLALLLQQPDGEVLGARGQLASRLVARDGLAAVLDFAAGGIVAGRSPWEPGDDADLDAWTNAEELAPAPPLSSDPLVGDSDGDGLPDRFDPCPAEADNGCLTAQHLTADTDADGVMDALDNCYGVSNPTQSDGNGDGIGDACEAGARIATPVTDVTVLAGASVSFSAVKSAAAPAGTSVTWVVDGQPASTQLKLGPVLFADAGVHVVRLMVDGHVADKRQIYVLPIAGWVCATQSCDDLDPCTTDGCDPATGCTHAPVLGCVPCAAVAECEDGDPCTLDGCSVDGVCTVALLTGPACDDGNPCTADEQCLAGVCGGGAPACDDGDPCTIDACVAGACTNDPDPTADPVLCPECKVDGDCGGGDECAGGACCTPGIAMDGTPLTVPAGVASTVVTVCLDVGQEITIVVAGSQGTVRVYLRRPGGSTYAAAFPNAPGGLMELDSAPEPGPWTLVVEPVPGTTQDWTLQVYDIPADASVEGIFGAPVQVTATLPGQELEVRVQGTPGQPVSATVVQPDFPCQHTSVYDPAGTLVSGPTFGCPTTLVDRFVPTSAGTWRIVMDPQYGVMGTVTVTLHAIPDLVAAVPTDGTIVGQALDLPGQRALFTFEGEAGDRVSAVAYAPGLAVCGTYAISGPSGQAIVPPFYTCGSPYFDALTLPETGTYTIVEDPGGTLVGTWAAQVWLLGPDPTGVVGLDGVGSTLSFPAPGPKGTMTFEGQAGDRISLAESGPGLSICGVYSLVAPSGAKVLPTTTVCGTWFTDPVVLPESGTYTVTVDPLGTSTGTWTTTVWLLAPDPVLPATTDGVGTGVPLMQPGLSGTVLFDAEEGDRVSVLISAPGLSVCGTYSIVAPSGAVVASTGLNCAAWYAEPAPLPETGTYEVRFSPAGMSTGTWTINVWMVPPDETATVVLGGTAASVTTTVPGQNATFTLDAAPGAQVTLSTISSLCVRWVVTGVGGASLHDAMKCGGGVVATLTLDGATTILANVDGSATGTFKLSAATAP